MEKKYSIIILYLVFTTGTAFAIGSSITITTDAQFSGGILDKTMVIGTGSSARLELLDTWYYHTASGPSKRYNAAIAYDQQNKVIVLFGGMSESTVLADTWLYNPATKRWTQKYNPTSPSAREGHSIIYIGNGKVAIFGGRNAAGAFLNEIWVYDVTNDSWQQKSPVNQGPSGRMSSSVVNYNENYIIVFGGVNDTSFFNDTWQYNVAGSSWTQINSVSTPIKRASGAMCYDKDNNRIILFGGYNNITYYQDMWVYNPTSQQWTFVIPITSLPATRASVMAYDETNRCAVLFSGEDNTTRYDDTWWYNYNDNKWFKSIPRDAPGKRSAHATVYVPDIGQTYIFAGRGTAEYYNDVWSFTYSVQGTFTSSLFDAPFNTELTWDKISILPQAQPPSTLIRLQIATSTDTYTWSEFKGYDGTNNTYYAYGGTPVDIWQGQNGHKNQRYLKLKAILGSSVMPSSAILDEVILNYNRSPYAPSLNTPYNGTSTNNLTPVFNWYNATDDDGDTLTYRFQLSSTNTFSNIYVEVSSITQTGLSTQYGLVTSLSEGQWFWHVSANDGQSESVWSKNYVLFIDTTPSAAVTDLQAGIGPTNGSISLTWTAPGENGTIGNIISGYYWLKYSTSGPIVTESDWNSAPGEKKYSMSTSVNKRENINIENLTDATTYYFVLRTIDKSGNLSLLSLTSPSGFTNAPAEIQLISITGNELNQTISWFASDPTAGDSQTFVVYLSTNDGVSYDIILATGLPNGTTTLVWNTLAVANGIQNRLKIVATDSRGLQGITVSSTSFIISNQNYPPVVTIINPQSNQILSSTATISWFCTDSNLTDTHRYTLKISSDVGQTWNTVVTNLPSGTTFYELDTTNYPNSIYYRILVYVEDSGTPMKNDEKVSNNFTISNHNLPPNAFSLLVPAQGEEMGLHITFSWESTTDPNPDDSVTYTLWYSSYPDFSNKFAIAGLVTNRYVITKELTTETTYWWIVKAIDSLNTVTLPRGGTSYFIVNRSRADSDDGKLSIKVTRGMPNNVHLHIKRLEVRNAPELVTAQEKISANTLLYSVYDYAYEIGIYNLQDQIVVPGDDFEMIITLKYSDNDGMLDNNNLPTKNLRLCRLDTTGWQRVSNSQEVNNTKKIVVAKSNSLGVFTLFGYAPATNTISDVHCYPNPFYPYKEVSIIKYVLTVNSKVQIRVYNLSGDLVWLQDKNPGEEGGRGGDEGYTNQIEWNGQNNQGMLVGNGAYLCVVSAQPENSNQIYQLKYLIGVMK